MTPLTLALKNLSRSPFRSWLIFLCALLIAGLALSTVLIVQGASTSLRRAADRMGADVIVVPEGTEAKVETALLMGTPTTAWMPAGNLDEVARVPGVAAASPQLFLASLSGASCCSASSMFVVAYDPASDFTVGPWLRSRGGTSLGLGEVVGGSLVVAPPGEGIKLYGSPLAVKTNLEPTGTSLDQSVFLTFATAREVARRSVTQAEQPLVVPPDSISAVMVKLAPGADRTRVAAEIRAQVPGVAAIASADLFGSFRSQVTGLVRGMLVVLGLTLLLSLLVISLLFSLAVHERRREIGVLRALGATRGAVLLSLLAEALLLATAGALVGIALSAFGISLFRQLIMSSVGFPFLFPRAPTLVGLVLLGLALALAGVAAGRLRARAARQSPGPGPGHARVSALISLAQLAKTYPARRGLPVAAVAGVDLEVQAGEFLVITGRSGSGKTTLLNLIAGLTTPSGGQVLFDGVDLWSLSDAERSRLRNETVGFVFQFPSLLPTLTTLENVVLPATFGRGREKDPALRMRGRELLTQVGLEDKLASYPRELSAGQQQRVVLARSMVNRPRLLLADEPSSNLDERTEAEIMQRFGELHASTGVTILMVTHTSQLKAYGTRAIEMAAGRVVAGG